MASGALNAVARQLDRLFKTGGVAGLSEGQLLQRFVAQRDEAAFEAIVARHGPMVLGVCRHWLRDPNDVDDAFQATFLVLVRKAGSLRRTDLLGNWLYGVAYRVAVRSRALAARRHATETTTAGVEAPARDPGDPARDLRDDLHEELGRLPESYRAPVVLCYLEGLTHEEAAAQLRWPVGTVKGRLSRARALLRSRLTRRGLTLGSASAVADLLARDVPAAVPSALFEHTIKAGALATAGTATTGGLLSAQAVALTEGVVHAMTLTQLKTAVVSLALAGSVLAGAGVYAFQGSDAKGPNPGAESSPAKVEPAPAAKAPGAALKDNLAAELAQQAMHDASVGVLKAALSFERAQSTQSTNNDAIFPELLGAFRAGKPEDLVRMAKWSRSARDAQIVLSGVDSERTAALRKHLDRMRKMHEMTQKLTDPDQSKKALIAHGYVQEAESELAGLPPNQTPQVMTGPPLIPAGFPPTRTTVTAEKGGMMVGPVSGRAGNMKGAKNAGGGMLAMPGPGMMGGMMMGGGDGRNSRAQENLLRTSIAAIAPRVAARDRAPRTKAILKKLDEPIVMSFPNPTPFEDFLKYIKQATAGKDDVGLPIYVDPVGLKETETKMEAPVTLDIEGVPLKTSLRLILKQLGLAYCVKDGLLFISSVEGVHQELKETADGIDPESIIEPPDAPEPSESKKSPGSGVKGKPAGK